MKQNKLTLSILEGRFAILRLEKGSEIPSWVYGSNFFSITRTQEELSIVCQERNIPANIPTSIPANIPANIPTNIPANIPADIRVERGWSCLKIEGPLDFGLTGILAGISRVLAEAGISIFAISTYDTDYVLVRETDLKRASEALVEESYKIRKPC